MELFEAIRRGHAAGETIQLNRTVRGRAVWITPTSVTPKRHRPVGVARLHSRRGGPNQYRRMRQTISIQVGHFRGSKWAKPE